MTSQNGQTPFNNLVGNTADLKVVFFLCHWFSSYVHLNFFLTILTYVIRMINRNLTSRFWIYQIKKTKHSCNISMRLIQFMVDNDDKQIHQNIRGAFSLSCLLFSDIKMLIFGLPFISKIPRTGNLFI